jgi:hypothetical protein
MTFPTPYVSVGANTGQWQIYSDTFSTTYPSGLQFGDLALMVQANSASATGNYPAMPTPTGSTAYTSATDTSITTDKSGTTFYNRWFTAVTVRFVTSAQSGTSIGAYSSVRCIILRCNSFSSANFFWQPLGSQEGSGTTYSQTVSYSLGVVPTASIFATSTVNLLGTNAFTHTFGGVAPANTYLESDSTFGVVRSRLSFNFQSTYPASNISVTCSATGGAANIHSPSYLIEY